MKKNYLAHKSWDNSMEWRSAKSKTFFSGTKSSKVLRGSWDNVWSKFHHDSAGWGTTNGHIEKYFCERHCLEVLKRQKNYFRTNSVFRVQFSSRNFSRKTYFLRRQFLKIIIFLDFFWYKKFSARKYFPDLKI